MLDDFGIDVAANLSFREALASASGTVVEFTALVIRLFGSITSILVEHWQGHHIFLLYLLGAL
jgi:hypothetical protein